MTQASETGNNASPLRGDAIRAFQKTALPDAAAPESGIKDRTEEETEKYFICAFCAHIITSPDDAIAVDGSVAHTFTNPAGVTFDIGCFREAPGCSTVGEPTGEFTWFPGFMWSYAVCSRCRAHMGWFYRSGASSFYGLILDNLREN